ncbi:MAG: hypothetical protein V1644_02220 [Candidatus Micrarchaeota archaeon]
METYRSNLRFLPGFGNALAPRAAASLVLKGKGRFGSRVRSTSTDVALEENERHIREIARRLGETETILSGKLPASRRVRLLRQREILTTLQELGARKMHAFEISAVFAFIHGLSAELHKQLSAVHYAQQKTKLINGALLSVFTATSNGNLARLHNFLLAQKRPVSSDELVEVAQQQLRLRSSAKTSVQSALAVLDSMGLVRKLPAKPIVSRKGGGSTQVYLHEEHALDPKLKHLTIPHWNYGFQILQKLHELDGRGKLSDLFRSQAFFRGTAGSEDSTINLPTVEHNLANLQAVGLVTFERKGKKRSSFSTNVSLTKLGAELIEQIHRENQLPEELRVLLLGQGRQSAVLSPRDELKYGRIVRWLSVLREVVAKPRQTAFSETREIAARLGVKPHVVYSIARGRTPFSGKFSLRMMNTKYLPKLEAEHPALAETLRDFLAAHAFAHGEKAFMDKI